MESHASQQHQHPIKSHCSFIWFLDSSPSKAIVETPIDAGAIMSRGDGGQGEKRSKHPDLEETDDAMSFLKKKKKKLADSLKDSIFGIQENDDIGDLDLLLNTESNSSLTFASDLRNSDNHDDHRHAFDFNFPVNNPDPSITIYDLGYDSGDELEDPCMAVNNIHSDLHAELTEDNGLDLELRIGTLESNASLNFTANPGNFDIHDEHLHAFDFSFPVNNAEGSLNINGLLGYDNASGEVEEPFMEVNDVHSDLHAGLNEENGLDLELRIGELEKPSMEEKNIPCDHLHEGLSEENDLDLELRIGLLESNASLNFTGNVGNSDSHDDPRHAGFSEDNGLDLKLRIGVSSRELKLF